MGSRLMMPDAVCWEERRRLDFCDIVALLIFMVSSRASVIWATTVIPLRLSCTARDISVFTKTVTSPCYARRGCIADTTLAGISPLDAGGMWIIYCVAPPGQPRRAFSVKDTHTRLALRTGHINSSSGREPQACCGPYLVHSPFQYFPLLLRLTVSRGETPREPSSLCGGIALLQVPAGCHTRVRAREMNGALAGCIDRSTGCQTLTIEIVTSHCCETESCVARSTCKLLSPPGSEH